MRAVFALLVLAACSGSGEDASDAAIANRAKALEASADATTDQLIREIEAQSRENLESQPAPNIGSEAGNQGQPADAEPAG